MAGRLHLIRAHRSMRRTSPMRTLGLLRPGRLGYALSWVGTIMTMLFWVSLLALDLAAQGRAAM